MAFPAVISKLGGHLKVRDMLEVRHPGFSNNRSTLYSWGYRGVLPAWAIIELMVLCEERGISYCSSDFKAPTGEANGGNTTESGPEEAGQGGADRYGFYYD